MPAHAPVTFGNYTTPKEDDCDCHGGKYEPIPVTAVITVGPGLGKYLQECLASVQPQVDSVVVVFDSCSPQPCPAGVTTATTHAGHVQAARRVGLQQASTPLVLFVDVDNTLAPGFAKEAVRMLGSMSKKDPSLAGAYPAIHYHTENWKPIKLFTPPAWDLAKFLAENFVDAGSLFWRHALLAAWVTNTEQTRLEDWDMVRQLAAAGFKMVRSEKSVLNYRKRADSMTATVHSKDYGHLYGVDKVPVTVFAALSGRRWAWPGLRQWLSQLPARCRLVLCDGSNDAEFWQILQKDRHVFDALDDVRLYRHPVARAGLADKNRHNTEEAVNYAVVRLYNRAVSECQTPYMLFIEDDVLPHHPPQETLDQLAGGMAGQVAAVSGVYTSRYTGQHSAFTKGIGKGLTPVTEDVLAGSPDYIPVIGSGFGLLLARTHVLKKSPMSVTPTEPWYDPRLWRILKGAGWGVVLATRCTADHRTPEGWVAPTRGDWPLTEAE